ncbi:unnamed protein product, partial [Mesorhabditis belari]|uniref:Zinc carboxypeptidase A 1 n=1 Tax=Mesorhabditis belari TaxID=2138241 RepID=A0AAF3EG44_9BILA
MGRLVWLIFAIFLAFSQKCQGKIEENDVNEGPFKVYRIVPTTGWQLEEMIRIFENADSEEADFWHPPSVVNQTVDVMVSPKNTRFFEKFLQNGSFPFEIAIKDLKKKLIEKEGDEKLSRFSRSGFSRSRRIFVEKIMRDGPGSGLVMGEYYGYATIVDWMKRIADRMPRLASILEIGRSAEGRGIFGIKLGHDDGRKPIVVIDAGIHAREWASIHTAMYFINLMANGHDSDPWIRSYFDNIVLYILPVLNPDGYEFTRNDRTNPRSRMWRKSRSQQRCAWDGQSTKCCHGVDLNRNFDFRFGEVGASRYPCSEIYHGESAHSEPETRAFANFLMNLGDRLKGYITLHAYSQLWIYSYSHRKFTYPANIEEIRNVAARAVAALGREFGTRYQYGTGPEIIYAFSGGSTDWATEKLRVKYSYTLELRPTYEEWNGFVLDKRQLIPTAKETWAGVKVVIDQIILEYRTKIARVFRQRVNAEALEKAEQRRISLKGKCSDESQSCLHWRSQNPDICRTSQSAMLRECPNMCDLCHLVLP